MTGNRREPPDWDNVRPLDGSGFEWLEGALRLVADAAEPGEIAYWDQVREEIAEYMQAPAEAIERALIEGNKEG